MRYGSICSGVAPQTNSWAAMGLECAWFAEIEDFPSAVLKHRFPEIPNLGDFTKIGKEHGPIELLVGGTPCQSFSVAGLRGGLADDRGNLALEFLRLADRLRPRWLVWENVPGVLSSNGGRDFGSILRGMVELGYGYAYRVLDAQYFGVPQRRRRVFVVGHLGDWRRAAAVLFERHSLSGHPAPRREKREGVTYPVAPCIGASGRGFERAGDTRGQDAVVAVPELARCLSTKNERIDWETETFITHSLRADGFDASEDGTGRGTPLVPALYSIMPMNSGRDYKAREVEVSQPIMAGGPVGGNQGGDVVLAFSAKDHGADAAEECSPTLRAGGFDKSHANSGVMPAVCINFRGRDGGTQAELGDEIATAMRAGGGGANKSHAMVGMAVRRLTPRECERLQGMPDDWTLVPYRGKPAADGPRYKSIGNSWAVPVLTWIGKRIVDVEGAC